MRHRICDRPKKCLARRETKPARRKCCPSALRQRDGLERADDVVRAFGGKETFVKAGTEVPVIPLVIFVAIKTPDATYDDETADPIVPVIADVLKTQVGA